MKFPDSNSVLVIGSGGREHAIARALADSLHVKHVFVSPGNGGTQVSAKTSNVTLKNFEEISTFCAKELISLVVVGPEVPLSEGIADFLKKRGIRCFGPSKAASIIEASKSWANAFMERHNIPTASSQSFSHLKEAEAYVKSVKHDIVIKASGLAAGKGVILPSTIEETMECLRSMMTELKFGDAGKEIVIEERLEGPETSIFAFTDGHSFVCCPAAQDHKRARNGDKGPNTGGMGAYAPSGVSGKLLDTIKRTIIKPTIDGLRKEGNPFVGVLFAGIMLTVDGPKVLEFNCRMGDPETQVILPLIKSDFYELVSSCADGCLDAINVEFWPKCACAVVAASGGYPGSYTKGKRIVGLETVDSENVIVSHAGTQRLEDDSGIVTSGGRVLAVTGIGNTMNDAIRLAYEGISKVKFENIHFRTDIAHSYAVEEKVSCTYADSGVNTEVGDCASKIAYNGAKATFSSRKGMIGEPIQNDGGFTGFLDFGDFCLVQGDDGVGTKIIIADAMNKYDTLGADLLAMVCDDAVCVGAETISISNTIDTNCVDPHRISEMMKGLTKACCEQKIVIPGGEIAELGNQLNSSIWNSTAVGIVAKDRIISGKDIQIGDTIIALRENGFRSNGFSLVRLILREHFQSSDLSSILSRKFSYPESSSPTQTYGEALLHPSTIYSSAILDIIGRYSERTSEKTVTLKGIVHVTGGGIPGNFYRILPNNSGFGAELTNLFSPSPVMLKIQTLGNVSDLEAYKTWNMGNGMLVVVSPADSSNVLQLLKGSGIDAQVAGTIIPGGKIRILSKGVDSPGFVLEFGK